MRARDKFVQNTRYEMCLVQIHFKELKGLSDDVTKNTGYGIVCLQAWLLTRLRLDHSSPGVRDQLRQQSKKVFFSKKVLFERQGREMEDGQLSFRQCRVRSSFLFSLAISFHQWIVLVTKILPVWIKICHPATDFVFSFVFFLFLLVFGSGLVFFF